MDRRKLVVASSANERFAVGLTVMLCSVVLSNQDSDIVFHIVDDAILAETREFLHGKVTELGRSLDMAVEFHFIELSGIQMPEFPTMKGNHVSYARMFFPELLEESSLYYLDSDIICNLPFMPLEEMEKKHAHQLIAGCRDDGPSVKSDKVWAARCGSGLYVNAGLLWINLRLMREVNLVSRIFTDQEIIEGIRKRITPFHDQTLINCHCHGRIGEMPDHYNVVGSVLHSRGMTLEQNWHFTGEFKPWLVAGEMGHLTIQFYLYHTLVRKLGLEGRLPYSTAYLPLSRKQYAFRYPIVGRLWLRSRKRFRRFQENVKCYQTSVKLAAAYGAALDRLLVK